MLFTEVLQSWEGATVAVYIETVRFKTEMNYADFLISFRECSDTFLLNVSELPLESIVIAVNPFCTIQKFNTQIQIVGVGGVMGWHQNNYYIENDVSIYTDER